MPEQQNIEYKSSWHDDYLKWICGFANAQGGRIYIFIKTMQIQPSVQGNTRNRCKIFPTRFKNISLCGQTM